MRCILSGMSRVLFLACLTSILSLPALLPAAGPRLNEFMAANSRTLVDEDGDRSDWIELHNPDPTPVNLDGWHLTDQSTNLTQWVFPNITVPANGYLLVFASGKDRRVVGRPLHTNFRLSVEGEFLALVRPDGVTVQHAYNPFPPQTPDVSYGLGLNIAYETLLAEGVPARALIPVDGSLGLTWTQTGFNDAGWLSGTTGIGYDYPGYIGLDVGAMRNVNQTVYARVPFTVANPAAYQFLTLRLRYEDGVIVWLNGTQVLADNAPASPSWNSGATANRDDALAVQFRDFDLTPHLGLLNAGPNVLAFQVLNNGLSSSDILLSPVLAASTSPIGDPVPGYFALPTPRAENGNSSPPLAGGVLLSLPGRTFTTSITVTLSEVSPLPGAQLRYTLDGSLPDESSALYTGPLTLTANGYLRARVFAAGKAAGPVTGAAYHRLDADVVNFNSNLPVFIIDNFAGGSFPQDPLIPTVMSIYEPVGGRASLTNAPHLMTRAGMKRRGSSTAGQPKPNLRIEAWDELDRDLDIRPLGFPAEADWILYAPLGFDPSLMHNPLMFELSHQAGRYATRTRFVEVFINSGGSAISQSDYMGVYVFMENIDREGARVAVERLLPEETLLPEISGGYILKIDRPDPGESGFFAANQSLKYVYPGEAEILTAQRDPQEQYIRGFFNTFGNVLYGANFADPVTGFRAYVDVPAALDHHLLNVLAFNVDALRLSGFMHKPRNGKLTFGPIWDFDRALGSTDGRDSNPWVWRAETGDRGTDFFNYTWWDRFFADLEFFQGYIDRWQELRRTTFSTANIYAVIDAYAAELAEAQPREQARWGVSPRGGSYAGEIAHLRQWLANRIAFMESQFVAPPALNRASGQIAPGFQLQITQPGAGTIYYTLDGSDPRAAGGGVAPGAFTYTGPVTLNTTAEVRARVRNPAHTSLTGPHNPPLSSQWSGVVAARLTVLPTAAAGTLVIAELNFHPAPPTAGELAANSTVGREDFEFLELLNVSVQTIDLVGAAFVQGIDYTFTAGGVTSLAAGERLLLARNPAAFALRYGSPGTVVGPYGGALNNNGERLHLVAANGATILDFTYGNGWHRLADGLGFSLQLRYENISGNDLNDPAAWRASSTPLGSPGGEDSGAAVLEAVVINEVLAHTDLPLVDSVELWNRSSVPVDVSHWWLTDDLAAPRKFPLPPGTVLAAHSYLVLAEGDFNADPQSPASFSFSSLGEAVWLLSADAAGEFTGYLHGFNFGASANGVSFGRVVNSQGRERLTALTARSLGAANPSPLVGPVVISELMPNPPLLNGANNVRDEFIELRNLTGAGVPLYDPNHPTNTWQLRDGVEFTFPEGVSIPANGFLLVVGFDPVADPAALAGFRAAYGLGAGVTILGPWSGRLDNAGERVSLFKPDPPQQAPSPDAGLVPMVEVDSLRYGDGVYWTTNASGSGLSLQRLVGASPADEPLNWIAATPTPGAANAGGESLDSDHDGLPTAWEMLMGLNPNSAVGVNGALGDFDNDGLTNLEEWQLGTHPLVANAPLRLEPVVAAGQLTQLRFRAEPGRTYHLQVVSELGGVWQTRFVIPVGATPFQIELPGDTTGVTRFYRVVTPGWK
jgi:hypothetical protein